MTPASVTVTIVQMWIIDKPSITVEAFNEIRLTHIIVHDRVTQRAAAAVAFDTFGPRLDHFGRVNHSG